MTLNRGRPRFASIGPATLVARKSVPHLASSVLEEPVAGNAPSPHHAPEQADDDARNEVRGRLSR